MRIYLHRLPKSNLPTIELLAMQQFVPKSCQSLQMLREQVEEAVEVIMIQ
jgi:hypothetical protein